VWQHRQRLARLEKEAAEARAAQADLQRRLEAFERIAAAAGADLTDTVPEPPVPETLLAAALGASRNGSPVRLAVDGEDVIAVIGDEGGNPREWWAAINRLAARLGSAS
jgi:sugar/nucleoside kinase (ribokinase family)